MSLQVGAVNSETAAVPQGYLFEDAFAICLQHA